MDWVPVINEFVTFGGDKTSLGQVVKVDFEHFDHDHGGTPWWWVQRYDVKPDGLMVKSKAAPAPYYLSEFKRLPVRTQ